MYMFSSVHHPLLYESVSESAVLRLPPHSLAKTTVSTRMYPEEVDRQDTFPRFVVKVLKSTSGCRSCFSRFGCRRSNCRSWDRSRGYRKSSKAYTRCRGKRVKSGGDTTQPSVEATAFSLILSSLLTVGLLHGGKSPFSTKPNFHRLQQCCQCQPQTAKQHVRPSLGFKRRPPTDGNDDTTGVVFHRRTAGSESQRLADEAKKLIEFIRMFPSNFKALVVAGGGGGSRG